MSYTLYELNEFIRQVLALNLSEPLWIKCELSQVKYSRGHCYLDLVQKSENGEEIIAQSQAVIWSLKLRSLKNKLGLELDPILQEGMEVLLQVKVDFHERFGLKLMVEDIDPAFTLGQLALKRRETILQLKKEGLLEKNKSFSLPSVIQRIAIFSSETAAGLKDFLNELSQNEYGYVFQFNLFPVAMQGAKVGEEIIAASKKVNPENFDVAVIVRGGGAKLDLAAFDDYFLCKNIAEAKLPIISGIGHEVDETVLDKVVHTSLKTPTAVAGFIINRNLQFEASILQLGLEFKSSVYSVIQYHEQTLLLKGQAVESRANQFLKNQKMMLGYIQNECPVLIKNKLLLSNSKLELLSNSVKFLDPSTILKRGFSITLKNGEPILDGEQLIIGDHLETIFHKGKSKSVVVKD